VPDIKMKEILSEMARGLAGTWVVIVADSDGMVLASWESPDNRVSPESFGGFIQIINGAITAFKQSDVGFSKLDDVTFTTSFTYMLAKPIADGSCFLFISAPKTVPLGMIRMAANNYTPRLEQALPGHETLPRRDGMGTIVP
jgi:predicted regulator of Ras-like GTPase activity (Roadblock/LC7/MglB family)